MHGEKICPTRRASVYIGAHIACSEGWGRSERSGAMRRFASSSPYVLMLGLLLVASATDVRSQSFQGGLRGAVKDANGVIPGAGVTLINEATNVQRGTVSNQVGEYVFAAVLPGTYTVRTVLTGFKTFERKGLAIGTQQFITLDLLMEIGTVEESISVTANSPLIETSNASTGEVLDKKTLEALPALNRNAYMTAVTTVPTVIATGNPYFSRMEDQSNGSLLSLGGGPGAPTITCSTGCRTRILRTGPRRFLPRRRSKRSKCRSTLTTPRWADPAAASSIRPGSPAPIAFTAAGSIKHGRTGRSPTTCSTSGRAVPSRRCRSIGTGADPLAARSRGARRFSGCHMRAIRRTPR